MRFIRWVVAAVLIVLSPQVRADDRGWLYWDWAATDEKCGGDCALMLYGGSFIDNNMSAIFGVGGSQLRPFWDWNWRDSHLVAVAFSRRIGTLSGVLDIEPEIGVAQRFGLMDETEIWAAVYFRWTHFPWNDYIKTTVALSTGLNYATGISPIEAARDPKTDGSRLLHFFSPEITFAHPDFPNTELVFRIHHRSGGGKVIGHIDMFNGVTSGAHHATLGVRFRF